MVCMALTSVVKATVKQLRSEGCTVIENTPVTVIVNDGETTVYQALKKSSGRSSAAWIVRYNNSDTIKWNE